MGGFKVIETMILCLLALGFVVLPVLILLAVFIVIWGWETHDD